MFKSFAIAALPAIALARGTGDGSSRDNASEAVLVDSTAGKLTLFTYNAWNEGTEKDEFHGDLEIAPVSQTDAINSINQVIQPYLNFGFCIPQTGDDASLWDCMRVTTHIDVAALADDPLKTASQSFTVWDTTITEANWDDRDEDKPNFFNSSIITYDSSDDSTAVNYINAPSKSSKTNCALQGGQPGWVVCDSVNAHWYRDWITSETDLDRQITDADADEEVNCWGWISSSADGIESTSSPYTTFVTGGNTTFSPTTCKIAFSAYITARDDAIAAANNTGNNDDDNDDNSDDGASTMLTSAAALAATVYAFTF